MWIAMLGAALWLTACSDDETADEANNFNIELFDHPTLGNVLVDGEGRVLYFFAADVAGSSNCTGGCLDNWPIFYEANVELGQGLNSSDFATITSGTAPQTTYKGWPLYYYTPAGNQEAAGVAGGDGVGGVWFVAKPNYALMLGSATLVGNDGQSYVTNYNGTTNAIEPGTASTLYFTDGQGNALYAFSNDTQGQNNFTADDFSNDGAWPIFFADLSQKALPSSMSTAGFDVIEVGGNGTEPARQQLTYRGWPLYYFGQDSQRGQTKGVSVPSPGVWPIITASISNAPQ